MNSWEVYDGTTCTNFAQLQIVWTVLEAFRLLRKISQVIWEDVSCEKLGSNF